MNAESSPPYVPDWVPASGHQLRRSGVQFDAVRIVGLRGEEVADALDGRGPIVRDVSGRQAVYFLLPPGAAKTYRWPPGVTFFSDNHASGYIGVPALYGETWPLTWWSLPTEQAPFVAADALHETLCRLTGWHPLPVTTGEGSEACEGVRP